MKKLITIALLCAMLLSCFASCGSMQVGELDVDAYAADAVAQNVDFKTELDADASVYSGTPDKSWYNAEDVKDEYTLSTADQVMGLLQIIVGGQKFAGVTFTLACDMDMAGANITERDSAKTFNGIFDGQGHVIGNWILKATGGGRGFFSSLGDGAVVKNVSFVDATVTQSKSSKNRMGSVAGRVIVAEDQTVTVSNVYSNVNFGGTVTTIVGGIVGQKEGAGSLVIENCEYAGTISYTGAQHAGILAYITAGENVTVKNCTVKSDLGSGNEVGGIVGSVKALNGALTIEGCSYSGTINAAQKSGGILGYPATCKGGLTIKNCKVYADITVTTMSGGIVGYIDKGMSVVIDGCDFAGTLSGQRTTGGIVGTLNTGSKTALVKNCNVTASLTFTLSDGKNNNGAGLIGKLQTDKVFIDNCHVNSVIKATFAPKAPAKETDDINSGAAGLIGRVFDGDSVQISNCSVAGNYEFIHAGNTLGQVFNVGRFVGSVGEGSTVVYRENNSIASDLEIVCTGAEADFALDAGGSIPSILPIGYQTRVNDNGTYDLRYVIAAKDMFDGVGVRANIRYVDANGVFDEKNNNIYVSTVYDYVVDEDFNIYEAAQYSYDYLYTLVVTGVPAEYSFDAGNLQVILKPFGATMNDGVLNVQEIGLLTQGKNLANTSAANMGITADNFSNVIDDKFLADGAIYIDGHSFDPSVSYGVHTGVKASAAECDGGYADGTLTPPAHIYLDGELAVGNAKQLMNATYNFKVAEAGWYDISVYMRLKGSGTDGDGAYHRAYLMMFDWAGGEQAYDLDIELDSCAELKDASAGTYLNGLKVYLEAGEHTVTFKTDIGMTAGYPHIRGIYLAKAD